MRTHRSLTPLALTLLAGVALPSAALAQQQSVTTAPPAPNLPQIANTTGPIGNVEGGIAPALDVAKPAEHDGPVVQLALLLDTSNSMDGLIDQARSELWAVVNQLRGLQHETGGVQFQVALYQYGNDSLESADGYVQLRVPFTTDLDTLSEQLFALTTNGGSEYCGWVIDEAAKNLAWEEVSNDEDTPPALRMIVVAGNEPFTQGGRSYTYTIPGATNQGVRVHTVFCGDTAEGESTYWDHGALLGEGFYFAIDQSSAVRFRTQYDDEIIRLGSRLNTTYLCFGDQGQAGLQRQRQMDMANQAMSEEQAVQRAASKATGFYYNSHWDLVDAVEAGEVDLEELERDALPEELRDKTTEEIAVILEEQRDERRVIQEELLELHQQREDEVAQQRAASGVVTLGMALSSAIIEQARELGFTHADDVAEGEPDDQQPAPEAPVEEHETGDELTER